MSREGSRREENIRVNPRKHKGLLTQSALSSGPKSLSRAQRGAYRERSGGLSSGPKSLSRAQRGAYHERSGGLSSGPKSLSRACQRLPRAPSTFHERAQRAPPTSAPNERPQRAPRTCARDKRLPFCFFLRLRLVETSMRVPKHYLASKAALVISITCVKI